MTKWSSNVCCCGEWPRHKIFTKYLLIWSIAAIPMVNFGIYLQLLEFIVGV